MILIIHLRTLEATSFLYLSFLRENGLDHHCARGYCEPDGMGLQSRTPSQTGHVESYITNEVVSKHAVSLSS